MRSLLLLLPLLFATPALAVGDPAEQLRDPALEARAQAIGRELRCMVCQNQSIEDSEAEIARDLRRLVREQVAAGRNEAEITRDVHARYGDFVLLRPPLNLATLLLWGAPLLVLLGGGGIAWAMRNRSVTEADPVPAGPALDAGERARLARLEGDARP